MKAHILDSRRQSGFTMVELMVGMLIGLIAVVVMFQVFAVSEQQRRTTTGSGDAHQAAAVSMHMIERDVRMAGYGINYSPLINCQVRGIYEPNARNFDFRMLPVFVQDGGNQPDTLTVVYGSDDSGQLPGAFTLDYPTQTGATNFEVKDSRFQFRPGSVFIAGEVPATGTVNVKDCIVYQVTQLIDDVAGTAGSRFRAQSGPYTDDDGVTKVSQWNPPGGVYAGPMTFNPYPIGNWDKTKRSTVNTIGAGGRALNLGMQPTVVQYFVQNNKLMARNLMTPGEPDLEIADGVVQMQVQYGYSRDCPPASPPAPLGVFVPCKIDPTNVQNTVAVNPASPFDQWGDTMVATATAADWRRVIAVRLAIVARNGQPDKPDTSGNCTTTTVDPVWPAANNKVLDVHTSDPLQWKCYRYRRLEMTVPIRNLQWYADDNGVTIPTN